MIKVIVKQVNNFESQAIELDNAIKKFKKICNDEGILQEVRDRRYYQKPSEIKRLKKTQRKRETNRQKGNQNEHKI